MKEKIFIAFLLETLTRKKELCIIILVENIIKKTRVIYYNVYEHSFKRLFLSLIEKFSTGET